MKYDKFKGKEFVNFKMNKFLLLLDLIAFITCIGVFITGVFEIFKNLPSEPIVIFVWFFIALGGFVILLFPTIVTGIPLFLYLYNLKILKDTEQIRKKLLLDKLPKTNDLGSYFEQREKKLLEPENFDLFMKERYLKKG